MIEIVKGHYGECRICDNMSVEYGLPSLKAKSWDLCLTDPPYNNNNHFLRGEGNCIRYDDKKPHDLWIKYIMDIFYRWKEICFRIMFSPGLENMYDIISQDTFKLIIFYGKYKQGGASNARLNKFDPFLTWNIKQGDGLKLNLIELDTFDNLQLTHPCPKPLKLWRRFITELHPTSVLDPFLGSGTTAEVCEELGIPWLGYEIMPEYIPDIRKRIERGIGKHKTKKKQATLF